jgi:hypothetical protein
MKKYLLLLPLLLLVGCEERFRYPCQDPANWEEKHCKKPYCSANGTCPEDLTHYEKEKANPAITLPTIQGNALKKGECK